MRRVRSSLLTLLLLSGLLVGVAASGSAQTATNVQDGGNSSRSHQSGNASAGQAITGQVVGVSSGGPASVNATNSTDNSTAQTGDATARNHAQTFAGQRVSGIANARPAGAGSVTVSNTQTGDNTNTVSQSANASTGDGVAGQVIGVVTSGGSSSIVASNTTTDTQVITGDAQTENNADAFAGLAINDVHVSASSTGCPVFPPCTASAAATLTAVNTQTGDNRARIGQSSNASTGDGVAGQVIGAVTSGGSSSIVASNSSHNVDVATGDATSENHGNGFAGMSISDLSATATALGCDTECESAATSTAVLAATNHQVGDNNARTSQSANASTGDGVAGQVIGAVTSGGSSRISARNDSADSSVSTGNADASNHSTTFAGLDIANVTASAVASGCFEGCDFADTATAQVNAANTQVGDNTGRATQSANATTGDGVAGQVIGAVTSGGSSAIVAANSSRRVDVDTGDASASNSATSFVGLSVGPVTGTAAALGCGSDCFGRGLATATVVAANTQTGDNVARASQGANASTGDGVAGQVIGAATSGGATRIDAANRTEDSSVTTGMAEASNSANTFAGLAIAGITSTATAQGCLMGCVSLPAFASQTPTNNQVGSNTRGATQAANASSGDAVGGQVIGAVSAGGPTVVRISNSTTGTNAESGGAEENNSDIAFVGLAVGGNVFF